MPSRIKCLHCQEPIRVVRSNRYFAAYIGVCLIIGAFFLVSFLRGLASGWLLISLGIVAGALLEFFVSLIIVRYGRFEARI